ncbi:hypothetical protein MASR2M78_17040 [Treponema sp.]
MIGNDLLPIYVEKHSLIAARSQIMGKQVVHRLGFLLEVVPGKSQGFMDSD